MAKPKFDPNHAFKQITAQTDKQTKVEPIQPKKEEEKKKKAIKEKDEVKEENSPPKGKKKMEQQLIYITKEQKKKIRLRIAESERAQDKDISSIVRTALDRYLDDICLPSRIDRQ